MNSKFQIVGLLSCFMVFLIIGGCATPIPNPGHTPPDAELIGTCEAISRNLFFTRDNLPNGQPRYRVRIDPLNGGAFCQTLFKDRSRSILAVTTLDTNGVDQLQDGSKTYGLSASYSASDKKAYFYITHIESEKSHHW